MIMWTSITATNCVNVYCSYGKCNCNLRYGKSHSTAKLESKINIAFFYAVY